MLRRLSSRKSRINRTWSPFYGNGAATWSLISPNDAESLSSNIEDGIDDAVSISEYSLTLAASNDTCFAF